MANQILLKNSNVINKVPTTTDLALGEMAINTYDGKIFFKKKVGISETIITLDPVLPVSWGSITGKPTTTDGYGITDAYTAATGVPWGSITGTPTIQSDLSMSVQVPATSGTSIIPYDNTTPVITEGTLIATANYNASSANSKMRVSGALQIDCSTNNRNVIILLFRNNTCVGASVINSVTAGRPQIMSFILTDLNMGSTTFGSNVTYTVRIGVNAATTWYVNRMATAVFNGLMVSNSIVFSEYL